MFLRRRAAIAAASLTAVEFTRFASNDFPESHTLSTAITQFFLFDAMKVGSWLARRRHDDDCGRFAEVQEKLLRTRLAANSDTAYGRDHNFANILAAPDLVAAFRSSHELTLADHYSPWSNYVKRIAEGEHKVINADPEVQLAATSGTSGHRNILPYTKTMRGEFFTKGILVVFDTLIDFCPNAFGLQKTCKLAFAPVMEIAEGSGLRIGPNSSGPKDSSFKRLLPLYSTPAEGYTIANDEYAALYVHALFAARDRKCVAPCTGIEPLPFPPRPCRLAIDAKPWITNGWRQVGHNRGQFHLAASAAAPAAPP